MTIYNSSEDQMRKNLDVISEWSGAFHKTVFFSVETVFLLEKLCFFLKKLCFNTVYYSSLKKRFEISFCFFNHSLFCFLTSIYESDDNISIMRDSDFIINFHSAQIYKNENAIHTVSA